MPGKVIGRHHEREAASAFLDAIARSAAALVFAGEPGIGKTSVWAETVALARGRGYLTLCARPAEAEAELAFAALGDLFEPVIDEVLPGLPAPQRHAVAVALARQDPGRRRFDQRTVAAGVLSAFRLLAGSAPVVAAIDDLQWLDRPTARVLDFTFRRLAQARVGLLACERTGSGARPGLEIEHALPEGPVRQVALGPLAEPVLQEIIEGRLGRTLPRRALARIGQAAGGNPFFAIEIARALPENLPVGLAVPPLPDNLRGLVAARIATLPERTRRALLPVAVLHAPTVELVAAGMGGTAAESRRALEQAAAAGIVEVGESDVRFSHPLFAAAAYSSSEPRQRRRAHRRLATALDDVEQRAWHLALAATGADPALAEALDAAAEHARARGAPETAFELTEHALRLTPPGQIAEVQRRRVRAAEYRYHAGELRRARELLDAVLEQAATGRARAEALRLLGEIRYHEQSFPEAVRLFGQALQHSEGDPALGSALELHLAYATNAAGDFAGAGAHARRALALAEQLGDGPRLAEAVAVSVMTGYMLGRGLDVARLDHALELEDKQRQTSVEMRPSLIAGCLMLYEGRLERACDLLTDLRQRLLDRGEESDLPYVSGCLSWAECWRGNLAAATAYADEGLQAASRAGMDSLRCTVLALGSVSAAYSGDADAARAWAGETLSLAAATGNGIAPIWAMWGLAVLALSLRDPGAACTALDPLTTLAEREGVAEPIRAMFLADAIEALAGLGQLDRAEQLTGMLEEAAKRLQRGWALAQAERCHALLLAARRDLAAAAEAAGAAVRRAEHLELRLELARTLLVAGEIERRSRRKRSAGELLGRALEIFESAGAQLWAQNARAELGRCAARRAGDALTDSEKLVAHLTASGLTNRQVGAQLFISPKTVEANLARVYRKLGVHSRAELGARLAATDRGPP